MFEHHPFLRDAKATIWWERISSGFAPSAPDVAMCRIISASLVLASRMFSSANSDRLAEQQTPDAMHETKRIQCCFTARRRAIGALEAIRLTLSRTLQPGAEQLPSILL
jgi:hypothetical protein